MGAFCTDGSYDPSGVCGGARGGIKKAAAAVVPQEQTDVTVTGDTTPWNANISRVVMGTTTGATADRLTRTPEGAPTLPRITTVYNLTKDRPDGWLTGLKANNKSEYDNLVMALRAADYLGPRAKSPESIKDAFAKAANEAASRFAQGEKENVDVIDYILSQAEAGGAGGDGTGGGRGGYRGPVASRTMMAESDIRATANALAIELIGRPVDDKELEKITKRMRGAEMAQPQITTSTTGSSVTQQGLTSQGREDILRDLISKNPEYQDFQVDTTVLDAMTGFINEKKQVSGG
jgi:hypothetical protein